MKTVIHGIVPLDMPAVVILIDAVPVNPDDRGMSLCLIQVFWNKQPARDRSAIGPRKGHVLGPHKKRLIHCSGHGIRETRYSVSSGGCDCVQICGVLPVGVLIRDFPIIRRPQGFGVGSFESGYIAHGRMPRIGAESYDANAPVTRMSGVIGVESNRPAVMRPRRSPRLRVSRGQLDGLAPRGCLGS